MGRKALVEADQQAQGPVRDRRLPLLVRGRPGAGAAQERMEAVVVAARKRRAMCIQAKAAAYEDGVSSSRDIAIIVSKECRSTAYDLARALGAQIEISRPLFSRDVPSAEAILSASQDLSNPDDLVPIILERRASIRNQAKPSTKAKPKTFGI